MTKSGFPKLRFGDFFPSISIDIIHQEWMKARRWKGKKSESPQRIPALFHVLFLFRSSIFNKDGVKSESLVQAKADFFFDFDLSD